MRLPGQFSLIACAVFFLNLFLFRLNVFEYFKIEKISTVFSRLNAEPRINVGYKKKGIINKPIRRLFVI